MPSRRSVLVGLGGLVAGGGTLIGTGAFTTVEAQRTVNVQTAGDASAFLGIEAATRNDDTGSTPGNETQTPANENEYVVQNGDTVQINLDGNSEAASGLNQNAKTTFRNLVKLTNNGTQNVQTLNLDIAADSGSLSSGVMKFTVYDGSTRITVDDNSDILGNSGNDGNGSTTSSLGPGETINFGMIIDLLGGNDLPESSGSEVTNYTLTITAETTNTQ
jgi:hypothetical protein